VGSIVLKKGYSVAWWSNIQGWSVERSCPEWLNKDINWFAGVVGRSNSVDSFIDIAENKVEINDDKAGSYTFKTSNPENEWHHYAVVFDELDTKLYQDGNLVASDKTLGANEVTINRIGSGYAGCSRKGMLDELKIFNRQLTEAEIKELADVGGFCGDGLL
jgi:hypothetical protein